MAKIPITMAEPAKVKLNVAIVGAGLGGLGAAIAFSRRGHKVTVFERAPEIAEVGAGIQVSPNLTRLLERWGINSTLSQYGCELESVDVRRWQDGSILSNVPMMSKIRQKYGTASYVVHRADFQNTLLEASNQLNIEILPGSEVVDVDFESATITLHSGSTHTFDLVIAADGVKSRIRKKLLSTKCDITDDLHYSGDSAYRAIINISDIPESDTELRDLVVPMKGTRWLGPGCHIMAYPLRQGELFNVVLLHPDDQSTGAVSWTSKAQKQDILEMYKAWDPLLLRLIRDHLSDTQPVYEWRLTDLLAIPTWHAHRVALMGDAAHATLPYVAQGSAQAIEDAAALASIFSKLSSNSNEEIDKGMRVYESVRKQRAESVVVSATGVRGTLHLPDGPEQRARDEAFKRVREGGENPDTWQDERAQTALWGHDAEAGIDDAWNRINHEGIH